MVSHDTRLCRSRNRPLCTAAPRGKITDFDSLITVSDCCGIMASEKSPASQGQARLSSRVELCSFVTQMSATGQQESPPEVVGVADGSIGAGGQSCHCSGILLITGLPGMAAARARQTGIDRSALIPASTTE